MKLKTCKICKEKFRPERQLQQVCSYQCSIKYAEKHLAKQKKEEKRKRNVALREYNNSDKNVLKRNAQRVFNKYIRLRDKGKPCISCGKEHDGKFDCGHFKPRGNYSALAFNEDNCSAQCQKCNRFLAGNLVNYKKNLIKKIGLNRVEKLEATTETKKWTVEELNEIIETYRQKIEDINNI